MLYLTIPGKEMFDETKQEFIYIKDTTIQLEHSLISLSRWESQWCKPFLSSDGKRTREEMIGYIKCMTMTQNVDPTVYDAIGDVEIKKVADYIEDPHTATWFNDKNKHGKSMGNPNGEVLTSEYIYYLMIQQGIPFECEKWHLNRLMTLLRVCSVKNGGGKKSQQDTLKDYARINAMRRAKMPHK